MAFPPEDEHCYTCRFFMTQDGRCHRYPLASTGNDGFRFPSMDDTDIPLWCGEYQAGDLRQTPSAVPAQKTAVA